MTTAPREITAPVELVRPDGRLNPDAVGWSRRPLHDTSGVKRGLRGLGRNKRWEYWLVTTPEVLVSLTLSDIDYAGVHTVWAYERATGRRVDESAVVPFAWHTDLPGSLGAGVAEAGSRGLAGRIEETAGGTRLRARAEGVRFDVTAGRLGAGGRTRCGGTGPPGPATPPTAGRWGCSSAASGPTAPASARTPSWWTARCSRCTIRHVARHRHRRGRAAGGRRRAGLRGGRPQPLVRRGLPARSAVTYR